MFPSPFLVSIHPPSIFIVFFFFPSPILLSLCHLYTPLHHSSSHTIVRDPSFLPFIHSSSCPHMNPFAHSSFYPTILSSFFHYFIHFLSIHSSIYPSIIFHLSSFSYIHQLFYLSFLLFPFHLFIYPLIFPFFHFPSIIFCPHFLICICPPIHPSLHLFFHTCFCFCPLLHSSMFFPFISSSCSNKVSINIECLLCA